jgi:hypothetical protein
MSGDRAGPVLTANINYRVGAFIKAVFLKKYTQSNHIHRQVAI